MKIRNSEDLFIKYAGIHMIIIAKREALDFLLSIAPSEEVFWRFADPQVKRIRQLIRRADVIKKAHWNYLEQKDRKA